MLQPQTLLAEIDRVTARALDCGALQPIATDWRLLEQDGVRFIVRVLAQLARKSEARGEQRANPFLPYDEALYVGDVSPTHVALLNKFNVIERHLLIVTREFVDQETPLDVADFKALGRCMQALDGLGFYNSGRVAGASQPHKHLQWVPLSLAPGVSGVPMEPLLALPPGSGAVGRAPRLPFLHRLARLDELGWLPSEHAAIRLHALYREMLDALAAAGAPHPYNLLVTRRWVLLVPRSRESFEEISVNALGFAGSLFVWNASLMRRVEVMGPMEVLRQVGVPVAPDPSRSPPG